MTLNNDQRLLDLVLQSRRRTYNPDLAPEQFFNVFAASQALRERAPSLDHLLDGIVDGTNDCGIDGIWTFVNGKYVTADYSWKLIDPRPMIDVEVLQAKTSTGFAESALEKLNLHLPSLLDESSPSLPDHVVNEKLRDRSNRFRRLLNDLATKFPILSIRVNYATRAPGGPSPSVEAKANLLKSRLGSLSSGVRTTVRFIDAPTLRSLDAESESFSLQLRLMGTPTSTERGNAYVCLVNLFDYYDFLRSSSGALRLELFDSNVRDFAGVTAVNHAIRETLEDRDGDDFWCFNNGVTILADEASFMASKLTLRNPQIVNGLQTSTVIFNHFSHNLVRDDRNLLIRVVVPARSGTRDQIIRATNSQTELPAGALRATEKIQIDLEEWLTRQGYYYERRANYYRNLGIASDRVVTVVELARRVAAAALSVPHSSLTQGETLLDGEIYQRIFNSAYSMDIYVNILDLFQQTDSYLEVVQSEGRLPGGSVEPWQYQFGFLVAGFLARTPNTSPRAMEKVDVDSLTEARARRLWQLLQRTYEEALSARVGTGLHEVASSPHMTRRIQAALRDTIERRTIQ